MHLYHTCNFLYFFQADDVVVVIVAGKVDGEAGGGEDLAEFFVGGEVVGVDRAVVVAVDAVDLVAALRVRYRKGSACLLYTSDAADEYITV